MLRQRPIQHKRKNSQLDLFYPSTKQPNHIQPPPKTKPKNTSNDKKLKLSLQQNKKNQNAKNILKLVQNSSKKAYHKETLIENIDQNQWGDQNLNCSNGACLNSMCSSCSGEQNQENYFQFGRNARCSSLKKDNYDANYNYLNMEEITQVPDTMSNQRRYQTSNFYQFPTSNQNSLINFSNKLIEQQMDAQKETDTLQSREINKYPATKLIEQTRYLKKRKQKAPKNVIIQGQINQKFDLSDINKTNKKSQMFFISKKDDRKSKSKEHLGKGQRQKSRSSLFLTKKSKNLSQVTLGIGPKKKSLSLKNDPKSQLKISEKKPKSFEKQKETSQMKSFQQTLTKQPKSQKSSQRASVFRGPKNLQIGEKIMMIEQSQSKLQNQYKVLWQCVGELWQNSRITRYKISEKNKSDIIKLKEGEKAQEEKLIKLKGEILSSIASARY